MTRSSSLVMLTLVSLLCAGCFTRSDGPLLVGDGTVDLFPPAFRVADDADWTYRRAGRELDVVHGSDRWRVALVTVAGGVVAQVGDGRGAAYYMFFAGRAPGGLRPVDHPDGRSRLLDDPRVRSLRQSGQLTVSDKTITITTQTALRTWAEVVIERTPQSNPLMQIVPFAEGSTTTATPTLNVQGLANAALISKIHAGDLADVELDRSDTRFTTFFRQYLDAYARTCAATLPPDRIEMTEQRCATEEVTRNGFGVEVNRRCIEYRTVGTNLFAKPTLYSAYQTAGRQQDADVLRGLSQAFGAVTRPDALSNAFAVVGDAFAIRSDMAALVQMNACGGPALNRFEENMRRLALNQPPLTLNGQAGAAAQAAEAQSRRSQDYARMIEDLIVADTKRWGAFARFVTGSVGDAATAASDPQGRPTRVQASYTWDGMLGRTTGRVTLTFADGNPACLIYSETPAVCHPPDRQVVARFLDGAYAGR